MFLAWGEQKLVLGQGAASFPGAFPEHAQGDQRWCGLLGMATGHSSCKQGPEPPRKMMDCAMTGVQHCFLLDSSRKPISQGGQAKEPVPGWVMAQFTNIKIESLSLKLSRCQTFIILAISLLCFIRFHF